MRRALALLLLLAALPGCGDRDSGPQAAPEEREPSWARRRPVQPSTTVVAGVVVDAPKPLAAADAAVGSPLYGGRALFDGDPRFLGASEGAAVAVPAGGGGEKKTVAYTAEARKPTLSVSEPPPPVKGKKTAAKQGAPARTADDKTRDYSREQSADKPASPPAKGSGACPAEMARVDGFCVDRHEAALIEVAGLLESPWSPYAVPDPARTYRAVSRAGQVPQGYVSGVAAAKACENAGKRLCAPAEWERACMGAAKSSYPYGAEYRKGACNEHDKQVGWVSTVSRVWGAELTWSMSQMNDPRINQQEDGLAKTGAFPACASADGVFDMVGNLHEWVADPAGTFRGGYYADTYRNGPGCRYRTTAHPVSYHDYSTGFRCCADPR